MAIQINMIVSFHKFSKCNIMYINNSLRLTKNLLRVMDCLASKKNSPVLGSLCNFTQIGALHEGHHRSNLIHAVCQIMLIPRLLYLDHI